MTAAIFYAKTKMGWKETVVNEHANKDDKPFRVDDARQRLIGEVDRMALVQIANTSRPSLRRCAEFRPEAPRSTLQGQLDLGRVDVAVQTVPSGCDAAARRRRS